MILRWIVFHKPSKLRKIVVGGRRVMFQIKGLPFFCWPVMQITWFEQFFLILYVFQKLLAKKLKNSKFRQKMQLPLTCAFLVWLFVIFWVDFNFQRKSYQLMWYRSVNRYLFIIFCGIFSVLWSNFLFQSNSVVYRLAAGVVHFQKYLRKIMPLFWVTNYQQYMTQLLQFTAFHTHRDHTKTMHT